MKVVTRFPPSPTGFFHIGSARTALYNYLFAARNGGEMLLRFEDTDKARNKPEFEKDIIEGLDWLSIRYRKPSVYRQSERTEEYSTYLKALVSTGKAYEAEEATGGAGKKVIRFKNPNTRVTFSDLIRGEVSFDTGELKDFVIARSIDDPLYQFAVVADDIDMGITHVIRGEDHISNTPRQILILEALGADRPHYAHIPLILAGDRSKMSKRHGAVSVNEYRAEGYLPEALVNYLALLGWNPGGEEEHFTLKELATLFDIDKVHKSGAMFDIERLKAYNRHYLKAMSESAYAHWAGQTLESALTTRGFTYDPQSALASLIPLIRERVSNRADISDAVSAGEFDFIFGDPPLEKTAIPEKRSDASSAERHLRHARDALSALPSLTAASAKDALWEYATDEGRGAVLWPLRYALTGRVRSPDPFTVAAAIGKTDTLRRIDNALRVLTS